MVANPPSTLLPPGVTTLSLNLTTTVPTICRWDNTSTPYSSMPNTFDGGSATAHTTTLFGLSGGLTTASFFVQCEAFASTTPPLVLSYRSLPDSGNAPFPRLGNLWGSSNFRSHPEGLQYAASRATLWLGSTWSAEEISTLRGLNPYTIVTTSINACETNDQTLPDEYYLTNITQPPSTKGRLQSWPGAWRLDLTNPIVQDYQAKLFYCLVVYGGTGYGPNPGCNNATVPPMIYDGLFVDNVFEDDGEGVNSQDIFHNPFIPMDQATGKPMVDFGEKWRSGMVAMIAQFRALMPHAILDGHAMDVSDVNITDQFNAISIGFTAPEMVEQRQSFASGLALYNAWMTLPTHTPRVTMIESAVRFALGYGYGFDADLETNIPQDCINSNTVAGAPMPGIGSSCSPATLGKPGYLPPQTYLFARSEYQYFRFGLGFTLLNDGFFTHELGDSWHGMDWDYTELHFNLGGALGAPTQAEVLNPHPTPIPPSIPLTAPWSLYVRTPQGSNASWAFDPSVTPPGAASPSVRVDIQGHAASNDGIDLSQIVTAFQPGGGYVLSFWGKASVDSTPVHLNSRKNGGDWHNFGLDYPLLFSTQWAQYNVTFVSSSDGTPGRLSWFMGSASSGSSLWINSPTLNGTAIPLPVLVREFECGWAVVNGDSVGHTILGMNGTTRRLTGDQAPRWQYFVDDANASAFTPGEGQGWEVRDYDSGYHWNTTTSQEEVRPPNGFYHHWVAGAHHAPPGSSATFDLRIPTPGVYSVSLWWPAAVPARSAWAQAMKVSITGWEGSASVDLSTQGGDVFFPIALNVSLAPGASLLIECPLGGGECIGDAVLVESQARWNDGSEVGVEGVTLQGLDSIILQKTVGQPAHCQGGL